MDIMIKIYEVIQQINLIIIFKLIYLINLKDIQFLKLFYHCIILQLHKHQDNHSFL